LGYAVNHSPGTETLKLSDVAWLLSTNVKTVQQWANSGIIKPKRITPQGELLFRRDDVARLLARLGV